MCADERLKGTSAAGTLPGMHFFRSGSFSPGTASSTVLLVTAYRLVLSAVTRAERMKQLQEQNNRLMVEGFKADKELAAAKASLANANAENLGLVSETASLKSALTITQTELYSARNALQVRWPALPRKLYGRVNPCSHVACVHPQCSL